VGQEIARLLDPYDGPGLGISRPAIDRAHAYTICMMPRSGSNFLIKCLADTYVLGQPGEYLHRNEPTAMPLIASRFGTPTLDAYMAEVMNRTRGANGVFGIKLHINMLLPLLVEGTFERTLAAGQFIYTTREDVLMQAISFVRAQQTGAWTAKNQPEGAARFDFEAIYTVIRSLTKMMAQWETFFALRHIAPLRITYEEIDRDIDAVVTRIADHLGVKLETPTHFNALRQSVQRDSLNEAWREQFLGILRAPS
jgi:LPS sulfotransferase NodH